MVYYNRIIAIIIIIILIIITTTIIIITITNYYNEIELSPIQPNIFHSPKPTIAILFFEK